MIIQNSSNNTGLSQTLTSPLEGYTCIGSYEDKPTDCVYYFLHSDDNLGVNGKFDCIVEYNHFNNKNTIVYQDGRRGSNGFPESVLNFSKSHLITGVNKVEDILYFTDNFNRPRKIDVEKGKRNEFYIKRGPTFQKVLKEAGSGAAANNVVRIYNTALTTTNNTVITGVSNNNNIVKNEILYLQQFSGFGDETKAYNGYSKAVGIVKPFSQLTSKLTIQGKSVTGENSDFISDFIPGDYFCVIISSNPYFYEVAEVSSSTSLKISSTFATPSVTLTNSSSWNLSSKYPELNTDNAIITDTPIQSDENVFGGKVLRAQPDDAYSPLISYGEKKDKIKYLDALSHQPKNKPNFSFDKEASKINHLIGKFFQFRYRYVYKDGTVSAYSNISDISNQNAYTKRYVEGEDSETTLKSLNNIINVIYNDSISYVDKIEIIARDGNDGEFFIIDTVNNDFVKYLKKRKNESLFSSSDFFFGGSTQTNISNSFVSFKNDSIYPFVSKTDVDKLQDSLPKLAKAQTILPKNRIAYGNIVDGYDNTDIYCNLQINPIVSIDADDQEISSPVLVGNNYSSQPTFTVINLGGPSTSTVFQVDFTISSNIEHETHGGDGIIELNYEWTKVLFQNHGINTSSIIPRGGRFSHSSSIFNPGSIVDVGLHLEERINVGNFILEKSEGWFGNYGENQFNGIEFQTEPSTVTASYNTDTKKLSLTFTYSSDYNPIPNDLYFQILSPDVNYMETPQGAIQNANWAGKNKTSGGSDNTTHTSNIYHNSQVPKSIYRGAPSFGKSYKTGANHSFGLVYYDETNRSSFVNTSKEINSFNTGTNAYSPFYVDSNFTQSIFNGLSWRIYHKPPKWATHYQWVYSGNTTVDEFIQLPILNSYKGTGNYSNKIFLGLGSLKGLDTEHITSYNEATSSVIDYVYAVGDRVRYISFGLDLDENDRNYFKDHIDVPISSYDLYSQDDMNSFTGGSDSIPGYYIVIDSPRSAGNNVEYSAGNTGTNDGSISVDHEDVDHTDTDFSHNGYHRLLVEIYRPKKSIKVEDELSGLFYEVGDKLEIENAGTNFRSHQGQGIDFFLDEESGIEVTAIDGINGPEDENGNETTNYAHGTLLSGDVYTRKRSMTPYQANNNTNAVAEVTFACESYYLTDFYNSNNWNKGRVNVVNNYSEERRLSASVYYSDVYSTTTNYNGLSNFDMANSPYYDYNQDFGSIQSLMIKNDDLIIFHENRVGRALVGKNIINYADGASNLTLSKNILSDYAQVYAAENGCSLNPESIVKNGNRFYFVDIKRGSILRLSNDGITKISQYGLNDYIRDKGELYVAFDPETSTDGEFKIVAGYDTKYDEYIVTLPAIINKDNDVNSGLWGSEELSWDETYSLINNLRVSNSENPVTIAFSELLKRWTSFYSYFPEFYGKINRQFISFKNGNLYKQNSPKASNFNTFYGVRHRSSLEFPFNGDPSSVKTYNSISIEGDTKLLTDMSTNMGQHNNSYDASIATNIGFKKVSGSVSSEITASSVYLYGDSKTDFYKDLSPGDLIRIYSKDSELPQYNTVKSIITKNKIILDSPTENDSVNNRLEVIDYKTKEGIQYSQIPFAPSKTSSYNESSEINYNGDASNIFGLGLHTIVNTGSYNFELSGVGGFNSLGEFSGSPFIGNKSVKVSEITPGARYGIISLHNNFDYSDVFNVTYPSSIDILSGIGGFTTASNWSVVSSGPIIGSLSIGTFNTFANQDTDAEIKTTNNISFSRNTQYKVSFTISPSSDNTGSNSTVLFKLGSEGDFYSKTFSYTEMLAGNIQTVVLTSGAGINQDTKFYIQSLASNGGFKISSLTVELLMVPVGTFIAKSSTDSNASAYVYPAEYKLYCMDVLSGTTTHEGFVYDITPTVVKFKGLTASSSYNTTGRKFFFIVKEGFIDGEKLKGHYLKTKLSSHWYQSKYKFNLYSANADVDKSELSNPK